MKSCKDVPDRVCQESSIYLMTFIKHLISQKYYLIEIYLRQFPSENVPISRRNLVKPSPGTSATMSQRPSAARKKSFNSSRPALNFFNCCLQPSLINVGKEKLNDLNDQVPRESCKLATTQNCRSVPVQDCRQVPREVGQSVRHLVIS